VSPREDLLRLVSILQQLYNCCLTFYWVQGLFRDLVCHGKNYYKIGKELLEEMEWLMSKFYKHDH
jgi:hypothetical protein